MATSRVGVGVAVRALRARRTEIEQAIFTRVQGDAFGDAGAQDPEYLEGLRAAVAAAVEYALEGVERGEQWSGPIPAVAVEQARRAARVGVSLDTVLRRYVVGHTMLGEFVMQEADSRGLLGGRRALAGALRAQAGVLDRLLGAITRAYEQELKQHAGSSPAQRRAQRVRALLADDASQPDPDLLQEDLGYDLGGWHVGVIATGRGADRVVRGLAAGSRRRLLSVPQDGERVSAWLGTACRPMPGELERALATEVAPQEGVMLALGEPARDLQGWRMTHHQAQAALVVALRRPRKLTRYADVALLASALEDPLLASALIDIFLSPLDDVDNRGSVLRKTLRAYLAAERNASSAAAALSVARSTVESRLRIVEDRLGRTLHPCPAELEIALALDELGVPRGTEDAAVGEISRS